MASTHLYEERFIQFGAGGFLRGFADWMIQKLNDRTNFKGSVVVVQPNRPGKCDNTLAEQNCRYTHIMRGKEGIEKDIINVISRCVDPYQNFSAFLDLAANPAFRYILSNTTEAGIVFCPEDTYSAVPSSFPGKLTRLLKHRFDLRLPGFIILPCELIDRNGDELQRCVLQYAEHWNLGSEFIDWVMAENEFCCTLVDRINTGFPTGENIETDFPDKLINTSEHFHLWVIETKSDLLSELPFQEAGLNVIVTQDDLEKYRTRKVRILNGAHTSFTPYGLLEGFNTVGDCMNDPKMRSFICSCIFEEIIPTLNLPKQELTQYAESVLLRFENPYIHHKLSDISLNTVSKFKVRVLPSILAYKEKYGCYPKNLMFSFKQLLAFYQTDMVNDEPSIVSFMKNHTTREILGNEALWGTDLSCLAEELSYDYTPKR